MRTRARFAPTARGAKRRMTSASIMKTTGGTSTTNTRGAVQRAPDQQRARQLDVAVKEHGQDAAHRADEDDGQEAVTRRERRRLTASRHSG